MDDFNDSDALDDAPPSKSQRKQGKCTRSAGLLSAASRAWARVSRPPPAPGDAFHRGLTEFDRLKAREARRRHLSFLGKLMRDETGHRSGPRPAYPRHAEATRAHHALEAWREALLEDGNALTLWAKRTPLPSDGPGQAPARIPLHQGWASRHRGTGDPTVPAVTALSPCFRTPMVRTLSPCPPPVIDDTLRVSQPNPPRGRTDRPCRKPPPRNQARDHGPRR